MKLSEIKLNPNNPRIIKDDKFKKLVTSLREFPEMMEKRPMVCVTDTDGKLYPLGGNMRLRALKELKYKEIPDSWVMLADEWSEEKRREFTIRDNVSYGEWDFDTLANEWDVEELAEWGLDLPTEWGEEEEEKENKYTDKVESPIYEPKNIKPEITELYNIEKYKTLIFDIENSNVSDDIKNMLKIAASRHIVFNYEKMADYYAHSDKSVQKLMEDSALIIIDFNRAIELGYVQLKNEIAEQYENEYGDEI